MTSGNIQNLLTAVSILSVVSMGMTFVILTGGIDLSVGSLLALSGLIIAKLISGADVPPWLAVVLTLIAAAVIGAGVNGLLTGYFGLSFFVVTLGTLSLSDPHIGGPLAPRLALEGFDEARRPT